MSLIRSVTFSKSMSFNSVSVSTVNDDELELAESFSISLSHDEGESVLIFPLQSNIWILDDDGMFLHHNNSVLHASFVVRYGNWLYV